MTPGSLPTLFVSHGAPVLPLEPGVPAHRFLTGLGKRFPGFPGNFTGSYTRLRDLRILPAVLPILLGQPAFPATPIPAGVSITGPGFR